MFSASNVPGWFCLHIMQQYFARASSFGYRNPTGFGRWVKVAKSSGLCYTCVMGTWRSKNRHIMPFGYLQKT